MAVVSTLRNIDNPAGVRFASGSLAFDSNYPTGGEAVSNTQWGDANRAPDFVLLHARGTDTGAVDLMVPAWNKATGKVQVYWVDTTADDAPLDEVTDTTSIATYVVDFLAVYLQAGPATVV